MKAMYTATASLRKSFESLDHVIHRFAKAYPDTKLEKSREELTAARRKVLGMNINEYQHRAAQLSVYAHLRNAGNYSKEELDLAVLGMCGEFLAEVEDQLNNSAWKATNQLKLEIGDFIWYLALYATWHKIDMSKWRSFDLRPTKGSLNQMVGTPPGISHGVGGSRTVYLRQLHKTLGRVAEQTKKTLHGSAKVYTQEDASQLVCLLFSLIAHMMHRCRIDPQEVYAMNIAKLEKRTGKKTVWEVDNVAAASL